MVDPSPTASVFSAPVQLSESQPSQQQAQLGHSGSSHPISLEENLALVTEMVKAADDRKAADIAVLNVADVSYLADYFVVVTGFSSAQVRAIARTVEDRVEEALQRTPYRVEGINDGGWVLLDYGDCIIHIFLPKEREFYKLEAFWGHATPVDVASLLAS